MNKTIVAEITYVSYPLPKKVMESLKEKEVNDKFEASIGREEKDFEIIPSNYVVTHT